MDNLLKEMLEELKEKILKEKLLNKILKEVVNTLILEGKTVSTMESCTGGGLSHYITNIPGASSAFRLGIATYSNEAKINVGGVPRKTIDEYTVYSMETAHDMARMIVTHLNDDYGVGITGQLKRVDPSNPYGSSDEVHISVYDAVIDEYYNNSIAVTAETREENKIDVMLEASLMLLQTIKNTKGASVIVECDNEDDLYNAKLGLEPLGIKVFSSKDFGINLTQIKNATVKAETIYNEIYQRNTCSIPVIVINKITADINSITYYDGKNFFICSKVEDCESSIIKKYDVKKYGKC